MPTSIVVTVDSCNVPRAYAGVISTHNELLQEGLRRWTDSEWKQEAIGDRPTVPWLVPVLGE